MSGFTPTAQDLAAYAPPPVQSYGPTPQVAPTNLTAAATYNPERAGAASYNPALATAATGSAVTIDPWQNQAYMQQAESLNAASLAPTFQQQDQSMQDQLAARGISSSGAGQYLQNQLTGEQGGTLAGMNAATVGQGYGYAEQNTLANQGAQNAFGSQNLSNQQQIALANQTATNASSQFNAGNQQAAIFSNQAAQNQAAQFGATNQQTSNEYNATAANQAANTNAQYYDQDRLANAQSYDQYLNTLMGAGINYDTNLQGTYLNSFQPNAAVGSLIGGGAQQVAGAYGSGYENALSGENAAFGSLGQGLGAFAG